jgi:transcriptional regulator with XRE-family HTH domain
MTTNYKLVKARESSGLTQEELAKAIGVKQEQVNMWERGRSRPYPAHLKRIAEATNRSLAWFHGEDELMLDLAGLLPAVVVKEDVAFSCSLLFVIEHLFSGFSGIEANDINRLPVTGRA